MIGGGDTDVLHQVDINFWTLCIITRKMFIYI